jgi:prepilin signal peptidase PulO-like enzyme (type II secretory pathway)
MLVFVSVVSIICVMVITMLDIRARLIPDIWLWPLLLCGMYLFGGNVDNIFAATAAYAVGFALALATRKSEAIGYGDVKLLAVAGLWLGVDGLSVAVVAACVAGIVWGLVKKQRSVPFAPFLFFGCAAWLALQMKIYL